MKKTAAFSFLALLFFALFIFTGCSQPDYADRISALESALVSQEGRIMELENRLAKQTPAPTPTAVPTAEPTATPYTGFYEYAGGPESLLELLPDDFIHFSSADSICQASVAKSINGEYTIDLLYSGSVVNEASFLDYMNSVTDEVDQCDCDDDSGFFRFDGGAYNLYNHYEGSGVLLQFFPADPPEKIEEYFNSRLVNTEVLALPGQITDDPYQIYITFFEDTTSVDTTYYWNGFGSETAVLIAEYYKQLLSQNEWFVANQSESWMNVYARLDEYRAISVKVYIEEEAEVQIVISNFTVDGNE